MAAGCNIGAHDIIFDPYCQRKNKIFNALPRFLIFWALLAPAHAQIYKWVDEKGITHYGEHPPQGTKARELEQRLANPAPAPGNTAQPSWQEKELEFRARRITAEQAEAKQKQQETANRQACNQARDRLAQLKMARGTYRLDEKGERVYQSDEEQRALIAQHERLLSERCR
ncbi:MAG: DUF4124 domain-containing protein [Burkholderiales bacterium]|nr:DUF4124 domain-containing protein [Burkholderiales bacterium]